MRTVAACMMVLTLAGCAKGQDVWANLKSKVGPPMTADSPLAPAADAAAAAKAASPFAFTYCGSCLVGRDGKVVAVSSTIRGDLERVAAEGDTLVFTGWGADLTGGVPARSVLVVSDGNVVAQLVPDKPRPDVSGALKSPKYNDFGFEARIPKATLGQSTSFWIIGGDGRTAMLGKVFQQ